MVPKIKHSSGEIYFKGDFLETVLFCDGSFIIMYNGVAIVSEHVGHLPDGISPDYVLRIRMAEDHIVPPGMPSGPVALFILADARVLIYEFWENPRMNSTIGTNGFWKNTTFKIDKIARISTGLLPIKISETIDPEKSNDIVKITKSKIHIGMFETHDVN
jgi:hypothetical protein